MSKGATVALAVASLGAGGALFAILMAVLRFVPSTVALAAAGYYLYTSRRTPGDSPVDYLRDGPIVEVATAGCGSSCACAGSAAGTSSGGSSVDARVAAALADKDNGFARPEMGSEALGGSVTPYDRHVFVFTGPPLSWPSSPDAPLFKEVKRLAQTFQTKGSKSRITLAHCDDPSVGSPGDVWVLPDMVAYTRLTTANVEASLRPHFESHRISGAAAPLDGRFIFVCCHSARDARCGTCGPALIATFTAAVRSSGLANVYILACSHVGGHKYAGNVIVFGRTKTSGEVCGDWYGYVTPGRVPDILSALSANRYVEDLWRGCMA